MASRFFETVNRAAYAEMQYNYGLVRMALAEGDIDNAREHLEQAIRAYQNAEVAWDVQEDFEGYANVQLNMGVSYRRLAIQKRSPDDFHAAIKHLTKAGSTFAKQNNRPGYVMAENSLGATYGMLAKLENRVDNLGKSLQALQEAEQNWDASQGAEQYAKIHHNKGQTYLQLAEQGVDESSNLQLSRDAFGRMLEATQQLSAEHMRSKAVSELRKVLGRMIDKRIEVENSMTMLQHLQARF